MEIFLWWTVETKVPNVIYTHLNISVILFLHSLPTFVRLFKYQFAYSYIDSAQEELGRVILQESWAEVGYGELSRVGENVDLWADLEGKS